MTRTLIAAIIATITVAMVGILVPALAAAAGIAVLVAMVGIIAVAAN